MSKPCDTCGVPCSTTGFLGGTIVCKTCSRAKREGDTETIEQRKEKYGGDEE